MKNKASTLPNADTRIKTVDLKSFHVKAYDTDNGYPQRMNNLKNASSSAKRAVGLYAKFIRGGGFVNKTFYESVVNSEGYTPDDLVRRHSADYALYQGLALHVNYNALFEITEVSFVPFENCRKTLNKDEEYRNKIAVSDRWFSKDSTKRLSISDIDYIDVFNPDSAVIQRQVDKAGGWENYKGQILYYSAEYNQYPLASCDSVTLEMKAEAASSQTTYTNLRNNFSEKTVFSIGTEFETDEERNQYLNTLKSFVGPEGENVLLVEGSFNDKQEVAAPVIAKIPNTLNDKVFEYSDKKVDRKILRSYQQPGILHTDTDTSALGRDDIEEAAEYYNKITEDERVLMSSLYKKVFDLFHVNVCPDGNYDLIEYSYFSDEDRPIAERVSSEILSKIMEVVDSAMDPEKKRNILIVVFGLSEEDADTLSK